MNYILVFLYRIKRELKAFLMEVELYKRTKKFSPRMINLLNFKSITVGSNFNLSENCTLSCQDPENGSQLEIGNNVYINMGVKIIADNGGKIFINDNVLIGPNSLIRSANHKFDSLEIPILRQGHSPGTIIIKDDVWIGGNAVILPNVTIGKGAVIAAGSVVTKNVEDYSVVAGVPAKKIKSRSLPS